jgi:hypothetical protein
MDSTRPVFRPQQPARPLGPTVVRAPQDARLFRGWGITL